MKKTQKRLYGTMIAYSNDEGIFEGTMAELARRAGFKSSGGMHTGSLEILEMINKITRIDKNKWMVHF